MRTADRRRSALTYLVWLLVIVSVVSWRKGTIYAGGADPVVVGKAVVAVLAAASAFALRRTAPARRTLSPLPALAVFTIVGIALVGSEAAGELATNLVLAVRIALLAASILLVLSVTTTERALATVLAAMASVGVVAAASGAFLMLTTAGSRARLGGGIPQLEPNELATVVLPAAIGLVYVVARRGLRPLPVAALLLLTGIIVWTGSRTALGMLALGAVLTLLMARSLSRGTVAVLLCAVVVAYVAVCFSDLAGTLLLRGEGTDRLVTLNSRTISWDAVFAVPQDSWAWWIGSGIAMKTIAVTGQYWSQQVFDSSWISSIAQDGWIGTGVLILYVAVTLLAVARDPRVRPYALPIVVTLVIRSFVENGLIDSSATFTLFFLLATATGWGTPSALTPVAGRPAVAPPAPPAQPRTVAFPASWFASRG